VEHTYMTRAIVFDSDLPRHLELGQFTLPPPAAGEAILQTELAGICGADHHTYDGWFDRGRVVPGHAFVGRIVEIGGEILDARGQPLKVGDRVVPDSTIPCRRCRFCLFGSVPIGDPPRVVGGWSEYVQIPGNALLHRIAEDVPPQAAVLLEPLAVAVKAVGKAGVAPGDTVVVQGPGPIGLLTIVAARAAGATRVILVGHGRHSGE